MRGHCLCKPKYCPRALGSRTFLPGHAQLSLTKHVPRHTRTPAVATPINCLACPSRKVGKPKYVGCTRACPPAQPARAEVWQARACPSSARVQPMQNVDRDGVPGESGTPPPIFIRHRLWRPQSSQSAQVGPIGLCMGVPRSSTWVGSSNPRAAVWRVKHRADQWRGFAKALPTQD